MYLRNCWYVAGASGEFSRSLVPMTILGENIVFYRTNSGSPVALEDSCPHRRLPLSMGSLKGDAIECGYHGLTFNCSGACIASPTQARIPPNATVKSYPVTDRWGFVWIWMGDPEVADENKIVDVENFDNPEWKVTPGDALNCKANYLYLADNLLDPSHVAWVHKTSFGAAGTDDTPMDIATSDSGVTVSRWVMDREPPPFYAALVSFTGNCDRLQHYEVRYPSIAINRSVFTPAGTGGPDGPLHKQAYLMVSYNFLTPIDDENTRYHWFLHRNTDPDNEAITARIAAGARAAFSEDREVLEAVQVGMADGGGASLNLGIDAGAAQFRRQLQLLIAAENDQAGN